VGWFGGQEVDGDVWFGMGGRRVGWKVARVSGVGLMGKGLGCVTGMLRGQGGWRIGVWSWGRQSNHTPTRVG